MTTRKLTRACLILAFSLDYLPWSGTSKDLYGEVMTFLLLMPVASYLAEGVQLTHTLSSVYMG